MKNSKAFFKDPARRIAAVAAALILAEAFIFPAASITFTKIEIPDGQDKPAIPEMIGDYPVIAVAEGYRDMVGAHTCIGGTASCTEKGNNSHYKCSVCGKLFSDSRRGVIVIDLGSDHAGCGFTIYSGRKSTKTEIASGTLDKNSKFTFNAEEGRNYTLVVE